MVLTLRSGPAEEKGDQQKKKACWLTVTWLVGAGKANENLSVVN
jgi:hypothetical protein